MGIKPRIKKIEDNLYSCNGFIGITPYMAWLLWNYHAVYKLPPSENREIYRDELK